MSARQNAGDIHEPPGFAPSGSPVRVRAAVSPLWRWRIVCGVLLLGALLGSRIPLAPRRLITFDEINFALSIRQFNPGAHQPQPPGYPLFVGLLKLLSLGIPKIETVFLVAALLLSFAALILVWMLGDRMLRHPGGFIAALLFLFNPPFWYSALTNPIRLSLAAGAVGVAFCLYEALRLQSSRWLVAAAAALGVAAGFRPTLAVEMAPLALWVAVTIRPAKSALVESVAAFGVAVATWLPFLAASTGGFRALYHLLAGYAYDQTRDTSFLLGARSTAALHMALQALVWSGLGVLTWVWAVPSAARSASSLRGSLTTRFLLLWFLPAFASCALFHVGDPDQTLASVPVTCLVGALVLSSISATSMRRRAAMVSLALFLNVFLFFKPVSKIAKASTYNTVRWVDGYMGNVLDGTARLANAGVVTAVFPPDVSGWRNLSYYIPGVHLVVVSAVFPGSASVFRIQAPRSEISNAAPDRVPIPSCGVIVLVDPGTPDWDRAGSPAGLARDRNLWLFRSAPGLSFRSHGVRFVADEGRCPPALPKVRPGTLAN